MRVVDASVALKWFADEPGAAAAAAVLRDDLIAPSLLLGEVASGLWKKWRRGELTREQSVIALANLPDMLAALYVPEVLLNRAAGICFDVDHPIYDCFYVALAERLQVGFVTADVKMIKKFASTGYAKYFEPLA